MFWIRRKKKEIEPELSIEEMAELVDENMRFAKKYAEEGSVSGMEMALEMVMKYGQKIGKSLSSSEIAKIKIMGYEHGEKLLLEEAEEFQKAGKKWEAQNAMKLAAVYGNEAKLLRFNAKEG